MEQQAGQIITTRREMRVSSAQQKQLSPALTRKVQQVVARYGSREDGKCSFSFANAYRLGEDASRCWNADVPTLSMFDLVYGAGTSGAIVSTYVAALNKSVGAKQEMDAFAMRMCVEGIIDQFAHLKLSEMILFFWRLIHGKYREADFYGTVDAQKIYKAIDVFMVERNKELQRQEDERKNKEIAEHRKRAMTRQEWEEYKKSATTA